MILDDDLHTLEAEYVQVFAFTQRLDELVASWCTKEDVRDVKVLETHSLQCSLFIE